MELIYEKNHPNGLKIFLAAKLTDVNIKGIVSSKAIRYGAQLHNSQEFGVTYDPNSAVVKLFPKNLSSRCFQWLDWERILQDSLIPYLHCLSSGKEDKVAAESLSCKLDFLNSHLSTSPQFFLGELGAVDVVLYCAMLPLFSTPKSTQLIESRKELSQYMNFLRSQATFQELELLYFSGKGVCLQPWAPTQAVPRSTSHSTWDLLKDSGDSVKPSGETNVPASGNESKSPTSEQSIVSDHELLEAKTCWKSEIPERKPLQSSPILPIDGETNILITSALPYVNNVPHLGNIIGCVLSADCFARFCRLRGDNVLYLCGTDEYGTATETKALEEGLSPKQICDKYHAIHTSVYNWFNISFDFFGRTTTPSQTAAAQAIFWKIHNNGFVTQNSVEQLYCAGCERFLADRFVEGTCPFIGCGYEDARGDQCDGCGKLVNATDLVCPRCKICGLKPSIRSSTHLFLDLPRIEGDLRGWVEDASTGWTANARVICETWLRDGLRERCITRDLRWGTPVPLEGFQNKVFYVWFDAPIGYISITMEYMKEWELWWKNPEKVQYYQFMAKDNVPFHSVIFPACQLATGDGWTKVSHLIATEYLNYEDGKFSKSRGVGVFGDHAKNTGIPSDVWRFYLLYLRPEAHDTSFSWVDLQTKNNSELLNNLGNFVNRSLKFVYQFYNGVVPVADATTADFKVMAYVNQELDKYSKALSSCRLRDGIRYILSISRIGNQYIQENEPYKLIKVDRSEEEKKRGATVINIAVNIVTLVAVLLQPYMPDTAHKIFELLNHDQAFTFLPKGVSQFVKSGHRIREPFPLIRKITDEEVGQLKDKFAGAPPKLPVTNKVNEKSPVKETEPLAGNADIPSSVDELQKLVNDQGTKVRELKSRGVSKEALGPEIELLLKLKTKLAIAQGNDPATITSGGGKKKKKK